MTNLTDEQIADGLVQDKILIWHSKLGYRLRPNQVWFETAEEAINDWRVAGKCLERMDEYQMHDRFSTMIDYDEPGVEVGLLRNPRAICEAYVKSLSDE